MTTQCSWIGLRVHWLRAGVAHFRASLQPQEVVMSPGERANAVFYDLASFVVEVVIFLIKDNR